VSFTGSVATGIKINVAAAQTVKRVTLELGGKSASIVFGDCNLEVTIQQCIMGFTTLSGQICAAATRIYVEESFAPTFIKALQAAAEDSEKLFGDPNDPTKFIGPIVDAHQHSRVASYIETGKSEATLVTGGEALSDKASSERD
jgi:aldehyde dehydrogenase (NAD+)